MGVCFGKGTHMPNTNTKERRFVEIRKG